MSVDVIIPPADIDLLAEAKAQMRIEHDEEDIYIGRLIRAAIRWLDGPEGYLGRCVLVQTLEASFDRFGHEPLIWLPYPPFIDLVSIKYDGADGEELTLDLSTVGLKKQRGVFIRGGACWPWARCATDAVRIRYTAGYPDGIPEPIVQAVLLLVANWYEVREPVTEKRMAEVPWSFDDLLAQYMVPTIC